MRKKLLSALLAVTLGIGLLAGCGGGSNGGGDASTDNTQEGSEAGGGEAGDSEAGNSESGAATNEDSVELKMVMISVGFNVDDAQAVEDEINAYIQPKINATVDIEWLDMGTYNETLNLKLTSGETIDILPIFGTMVSTMYGQGALKEMSGLIETSGQDIVDAVGADYMRAGEINGEQYSIPIIQAFASETSLVYRTDIVEKYNIDLSSVKELSDLTPILAQIHEAEPELTLLVPSNPTDSMLREWDWDGLGDEYGVLMDPTTSTEVVNLYETERYKEYVTLMHEWYEAGYIMKDATTNGDNLTTIFDSGTAFGTIGKNYPGNLEEKFARCAYDFDAVKLVDPIATTNRVTDNVITIPETSQHPEKAMEFINLLYSDPTVQNLMCWGIEGQHYRIVDADKGIVDFLEGENIMSCKYVSKYMVGNKLIAYTDVSAPDGINDILTAYNADAQKSLALGFSYDSTNVSNDLTALSQVVNKYRKGLECGSMDPETELPKFIEELKTAGIDNVINEKQTQLNSWLGQ